MPLKDALAHAISTQRCWISPDRSEIRWILPLKNIDQRPPEGYCIHQIDITVSFRTPNNAVVLEDVEEMLKWAATRNKGEYVGPVITSLNSDARDAKYMVRSFSARRAKRMAEWLSYVGGTVTRINVTYTTTY